MNNSQSPDMQTETIDRSLIDMDLKANDSILSLLLQSQQRAFTAVESAKPQLDIAVREAALRLRTPKGRLVLVGAGASGRIAVQDGAELWPTFGWPDERLLTLIAGGNTALVKSVEAVEDDEQCAREQVIGHRIGKQDVVVCVAASGRSPWTCQWLESASANGALSIAIANNRHSRLLNNAEIPVFLDSGAEILAGSTRMAAGTAQKIALNLLSTTLMIRMNRTYGNLMVDMAAVNAKLDERRIRLLQGVLPEIDTATARRALTASGGWVKLAALVALGDDVDQARVTLAQHNGSLRAALDARDH